MCSPCLAQPADIWVGRLGMQPARMSYSARPWCVYLNAVCIARTMFEKREYMMQHMDHYRRLLLLEPRGYPCQNANFILPPTHPDASFGYVIAEQNAIYPAMSG